MILNMNKFIFKRNFNLILNFNFLKVTTLGFMLQHYLSHQLLDVKIHCIYNSPFENMFCFQFNTLVTSLIQI